MTVLETCKTRFQRGRQGLFPFHKSPFSTKLSLAVTVVWWKWEKSFFPPGDTALCQGAWLGAEGAQWVDSSTQLLASSSRSETIYTIQMKVLLKSKIMPFGFHSLWLDESITFHKVQALLNIEYTSSSYQPAFITLYQWQGIVTKTGEKPSVRETWAWKPPGRRECLWEALDKVCQT